MITRFLKTSYVLKDPQIAQLLFADTRFSPIWLLVRIYTGMQWLNSAGRKLQDPSWMQTGEALKAFWANAVKIPAEGRPPIEFDWYRNFINYLLSVQAYTWFAKVVAFGELLVGICLILGIFVGAAAFFGAFMNWNYIMAGSASLNGLLLVLSMLLILAWKTAGYIGLDHFLFPLIGAPWGRIERLPVPVRRSYNCPALPGVSQSRGSQ